MRIKHFLMRRSVCFPLMVSGYTLSVINGTDNPYLFITGASITAIGMALLLWRIKSNRNA